MSIGGDHFGNYEGLLPDAIIGVSMAGARNFIAMRNVRSDLRLPVIDIAVNSSIIIEAIQKKEV